MATFTWIQFSMEHSGAPGLAQHCSAAEAECSSDGTSQKVFLALLGGERRECNVLQQRLLLCSDVLSGTASGLNME